MKNIYFFIFTFFTTTLFAQNLDWELTVPPNSRNIQAIELFSNGKVIAVGGNPTNDSIQFIGSTANGINNWEIYADAPNTPMVQDMFFLDDNNGFVCGNAGSILKTTDNGNTWTTLNTPPSVRNRQLMGIFFNDENNGVVVGGRLSNDSITTILKTTDGGSTWSVIQDNQGERLNAVYFISNTTGYAVGNNGLLLKTSDGGSSWTAETIAGNPGTRHFNSIFFTEETTGFIVGGNPSLDSIQTILKTTTAGNTWSVIKDEVNPMLQDIHFYDTDHGLSVGNNGAVLYTSDAGDTWTNQTLPNVNDLWNFRSVFYLDDKNAAIGGLAGAVFLSYDSATFYTSIQSQLENSAFTIYPNPTQEVLYFSNQENTSISKIEVISISGQILKELTGDKQRIDISNLETGYYYLKITNQTNHSFYYKFLKS